MNFEDLKLKIIDEIKGDCMVLYRNTFYHAVYTKQWRYIVFNSKLQPMDITDKKFVIVPDWMSIVEFSILRHGKSSFRF